ncbi:DUF6470 family protein [Paenibacillus sp. GCM10012307]|uniref:Uncharacterized protein n=1 Tax=Paenibacillus roseus TaxID=2798579 RepID=A0A934MR26_9BACL|nr:DUF6470 family protein [Paenibacillus roseus]MBJ6361929.1 hypothetical protein [Paenibacillus roseus]
MTIPQIQIRQQYGQIGIHAERGQQEIEQPRPEISMVQHRAQMNISRSEGYLEINQERAWDALALGNNLETMKKIYSMAPEIAMRGIARRVEEGKQLANLLYKGNAIADIAKGWRQRFPEFDFRGPASGLNVDLYYTPSELSIDTEVGSIEYDVRTNAPILQYETGKLDIYMKQWPNIEITVDMSV